MCIRPRAESTGCSKRWDPSELALAAPCVVAGILPPALRGGGTQQRRSLRHQAVFFGCPLWVQSQLERGNRARQGTGEGREKGCFPGHSRAPAIKLQNSKPGWGGAASGELRNRPPREPRRS